MECMFRVACDPGPHVVSSCRERGPWAPSRKEAARRAWDAGWFHDTREGERPGDAPVDRWLCPVHARAFGAKTRQEQEAEAAEAVVNQLPKTADGVSVTDGMATFCVHLHSHTWKLRARDGETYRVHAEGEPQYSTREAALAASDPATPGQEEGEHDA